jgi:hypothetical protein
VTIVPPGDDGGGPRLAASVRLLDAARRYAAGQA